MDGELILNYLLFMPRLQLSTSIEVMRDAMCSCVGKDRIGIMPVALQQS